MIEISGPGSAGLIAGVGRFQAEVFGTKADLFRRLGGGQNPPTLFITCSDSRIDQGLLTQTEPGELFVLRNAGNLLPAFRDGVASGEAATIEFAVRNLRVSEVVLCGHSKCGAMAGLLAPDDLHDLPAVKAWLAHADGVVAEVDRLSAGRPAADRLALAVERNVVRQIANLMTHPAVREAVAAGRVRVRGWVYHFETGAVTALDPAADRFVPLAEAG